MNLAITNTKAQRHSLYTGTREEQTGGHSGLERQREDPVYTQETHKHKEKGDLR